MHEEGKSYCKVKMYVGSIFWGHQSTSHWGMASPMGSKLQQCFLSFIVISNKVFVLKGNDGSGTPIQFVISLHVSFLYFQN
jgi:hypothetical protein